jgi:hypothetical protein
LLLVLSSAGYGQTAVTTRPSNLTLTTSEGDIDVMDRIAGVGDYAAVRLHSERISALGVGFRVLDLPSLIKAKRAAGRPRDHEHLPELEALLALGKR